LSSQTSELYRIQEMADEQQDAIEKFQDSLKDTEFPFNISRCCKDDTTLMIVSFLDMPPNLRTLSTISENIRNNILI